MFPGIVCRGAERWAFQKVSADVFGYTGRHACRGSESEDGAESDMSLRVSMRLFEASATTAGSLGV